MWESIRQSGEENRVDAQGRERSSRSRGALNEIGDLQQVVNEYDDRRAAARNWSWLRAGEGRFAAALDF